MQTVHKPVLLNETVESLTANSRKIRKSKKDGDFLWYLDGTLGGGSHALAIIKTFQGKVNMIGLDRDPSSISRAKETFKVETGKIILENENFRNIDSVLNRNGIKEVDLILLDLGISSDELEVSGKGFSFQKDEPLLMTLGKPSLYPFTAKDIVNGWEETVLADIIYGYGEERFARRIAKAIVTYRTKKKFETSSELAEVVTQAIPSVVRRKMMRWVNPGAESREGRAIQKYVKHPATKTFQALRIAVNDELNALRDGITKGYERLSRGGRMAVISFHSLEDRIVKNFYKEKEKESGEIINKKPITASEKEISENPRSRSAKLRVIQKN